MPFQDDDFLFGVIDVVECEGELRFTHEPGCRCSGEGSAPPAPTAPAARAAT